MTQRPTEVEFMLLKRLAALEQASAQQSAPTLWGYITSILPVPLLVLAGAAFLSFHAWEYYNKGQQEAAKTRIERIQAALATYDATTANLKVGDLPAQTAKLRAELARLQADVASKQAQAEKTRAEADAAMQKSGLYTLEERLARARLVIAELQAASARESTAVAASLNNNNEMFEAALGALCKGNRYAELIDCPARFLAGAGPAPSPPLSQNEDRVAAEAPKPAPSPFPPSPLLAENQDQAATPETGAVRDTTDKTNGDKPRSVRFTGGQVLQCTCDAFFTVPWAAKMEINDEQSITIGPGDLIRIVAVHKGADGVDDFYRIKLITTNYKSNIVWIPAPVFDEHKSSMRVLSRTEVASNPELK